MIDDDLALALAKLLASNDGMAERLLRLHVDDGAGLCAVCSTDTTRTAWPCSISWYVTRAAGTVVEVAVPDMSRTLSGSS